MSALKIFNYLRLADKEFHRLATIDLLELKFWQILKNENVDLQSG